MLRKYSVCYSEKEGFDWCIVNAHDVVLTNGVGNMAQVRDIVDAANNWFAQVYKEQNEEVDEADAMFTQHQAMKAAMAPPND
jgi:hypothetical protein